MVDAQDIEHIVSTWTSIPVERMSQDEKEKLLRCGQGQGHWDLDT